MTGYITDLDKPKLTRKWAPNLSLERIEELRRIFRRYGRRLRLRLHEESVNPSRYVFRSRTSDKNLWTAHEVLSPRGMRLIEDWMTRYIDRLYRSEKVAPTLTRRPDDVLVGVYPQARDREYALVREHSVYYRPTAKSYVCPIFDEEEVEALRRVFLEHGRRCEGSLGARHQGAGTDNGSG